MDNFSAEADGPPTDYSGLIIAAMLAPVFFFFVHLNRADEGFGVVLVLGISIFALRLRLKLRRHAWFWVASVFVLAVQLSALLFVPWPHGKGPVMLFALPMGFASFLITSGLIQQAEKVFSNGSPTDDDEEE